MKVTLTHLVIAMHYVQFQNSAFISFLEWSLLMGETRPRCKNSEEFFNSSNCCVNKK